MGDWIIRQLSIFAPELWYWDPVTTTIDLSELILPFGVIRKSWLATWNIELLTAGAKEFIVLEPSLHVTVYP